MSRFPTIHTLAPFRGRGQGEGDGLSASKVFGISRVAPPPHPNPLPHMRGGEGVLMGADAS
jgi:hypothetical protein